MVDDDGVCNARHLEVELTTIAVNTFTGLTILYMLGIKIRGSFPTYVALEKIDMPPGLRGEDTVLFSSQKAHSAIRIRSVCCVALT